MSFSHSPRIVTDGLVLCLDAANPQSYPGSGTSWADLSGNGNTGTLTNGPTFSTGNSGSIVFDGNDDSVIVPNGNTFFSNKTQVSVCVWFKLNSRFRPNLINIPAGSGQNFSIESGQENATSLSTYFNNNNQTIFPFNLNTPTYLVSIFNSGVLTTYKDGILIDTKNNNSNVLNTFGTTNLVIGRWGWEYGNSMDGSVYNTQIYNRALSASEVLQNYEAVKSRFGL